MLHKKENTSITAEEQIHKRFWNKNFWIWIIHEIVTTEHGEIKVKCVLLYIFMMHLLTDEISSAEATVCFHKIYKRHMYNSIFVKCLKNNCLILLPQPFQWGPIIGLKWNLDLCWFNKTIKTRWKKSTQVAFMVNWEKLYMKRGLRN